MKQNWKAREKATERKRLILSAHLRTARDACADLADKLRDTDALHPLRKDAARKLIEMALYSIRRVNLP